MVFLKIKKNEQGQLLLEALLSIAIIGILAGFVVNMVSVSIRTNQASGKQSVALALAQEALIVVRTIKDTNDNNSRGWNKIYEINELLDYHPEDSGVAWVLVSGTEDIVVDNYTYTRKINFDIDINRDEINGGGDISTLGTKDPSTVKATVTVTAPGISGIILEEYLTRSKNEIKVWNTSSADDPDLGEGFKSSGANCMNTKILGTGSSASVELISSASC